MAVRLGLTIVAVLGLAVAGCGGSSATPTPAPAVTDAPPAATMPPAAATPVSIPSGAPADTLEGVEWLLAQMSDGSVMNDVPSGIEVTLTMLDGVAAGWTGCNDYRGPYTVDGQGLVFGEMASTVKACDDAATIVESNYLQALSFVARFGVRETGLLLVSPPGAPLLAFAPKPTGDIRGEWVLAEMQNAQGAIIPPIDGTELSTTFADDGRLSGNDGCNDYTGAWQTDGPRITISSVGGERAACPSEDLSDQEAQFLAMLQASTIWTATDSTLTFRGTNGIVTLVYARRDAQAPGPDASPAVAGASPAAS